MGSYTEFKCKITLRKDTPEIVLALLKRVLIERDLGNEGVLFTSDEVFVPELDHELFKCERWYMLFLSTNWDDSMQGGKMYEHNGLWVIDLHTEFKDYDDEIEKFVDWITPFVIGRKKKKFIGYSKHEDSQYRINYYIERHQPV